MPGRTTVRDYWNAHSEVFSEYYQRPSWFDRVFRKALFVRGRVAVEACQRLSEPTVLDIGSGPGTNSIAMIKQGGARSVTGIDFADDMNALARTLAEQHGVADRCRFLTGDFMRHSFEPNGFDVVTALGVFDYVDDPEGFLNKAAACAASTVVASWPEPGLRMLLRKLRYSCPVHPYTAERIGNLHEAAGLSLVELQEVPGGWVSTGRVQPRTPAATADPTGP